jgi:predicted RNA-binding protein with EMAP domain
MSTTDRRSYNERIREEQKARGFRRVSVTLSPVEYAHLKQHADAHQERVTSHLKQCAFSYLDARYLVPPDVVERLDSLLSIMRGIGNNLNQLARHSNEMRYFLDTDSVRLQLKRMDEEVRRFVAEPMPGGDGRAPP